jgi:hypothetical protein
MQMNLLLPLSAVCALTLTSGAYGQTLTNFSAVNLALGQPNLATTNYVSPATAASLDETRGVVVDATGYEVFAAETEDNREVQCINPPPYRETYRPTLVLSKYLKTTKAAEVTVKGTASDGSRVASVSYRIGTGAVKKATGTTTWSFKATLKKGQNKFTVFATDMWGNVSIRQTIIIKRN